VTVWHTAVEAFVCGFRALVAAALGVLTAVTVRREAMYDTV
jgi:hypothetical protein